MDDALTQQPPPGDDSASAGQLAQGDVSEVLDRMRGLTLKFQTFRGAKLQEALFASMLQALRELHDAGHI